MAGVLAGEDVPCAHASVPQEKMATTNTLLFIQDVYSIPPTLTREHAVFEPEIALLLYVRFLQIGTGFRLGGGTELDVIDYSRGSGCLCHPSG